ncbi:MAG: PAS domain S-box protein, partial [Anaerolineae bacterium]
MSDDERPSLSKSISQLTVLHQISREIAASLHLDQILVQATSLVRKYYGYDHVTYFTLDKERDEVVLEARSSIFEEKLPSQNRQKIKEGMLGWVAQNKQSLLVNDVSVDPRHVNPFPDILTTQSELTVPVIAGNALIGLLDIQSVQPQAFDETDVLTLETLAGQLAVAIENARLHQKVRLELAERIRIERSLRESEASMRMMLYHAPEAIVIWDGETGRFVDANANAEKLFGLNRSALKEMGPIDLSPPLQPDGRTSGSVALKFFQEALAGGAPTYEWIHQRANGELVPCEIRLVRLPLAGRVLIRGSITDITDRQQAERALREREDRFRDLAESARDAIITITADSTIHFFNPAAERIFGFSAAEALGESLDIIIPEEYGQRHHQAVARYLQTRIPRILGQTIEIKGRRKSGEIFPVELSLSEAKVEGEIIFTGIIRDITERKLAETHLREARLKAVTKLNELNHIYDQVPEGLGFLDKDLRFLRLNERMAAINGFSVAEHLGKTLREMSPDMADQLEPIWHDVMLAGREIRFETAVPDSGHDWVVKYKPSLDSEGEVTGVSVMVIDVTDLKQAEREAQNRAYQQEIIASLSQQALSGLALPWLMDQVVNLTAVTLDVGFCKILELLPGEEELLLKAGVGWHEGLVGHATVGVELESQAGYTLVSEGPVIVHDLAAETRFSGPDLLINHNVVSGISVIIPGDGRPYGVFAVHTTQPRDFTRHDVNFIQSVANILAVAIQRHQAEGILVESESRYRLLIETMNEGLIQADKDDTITFVNPKLCQMLGYRAEELIGKASAQILVNDDQEREKIRAANERRQKGVSDSYVIRTRHKSGHPAWMRVHGSPAYDSVGNLMGTVGILEDITDSLRAERALKESEVRLRKIFQAVPIGVGMVQDRRIMFANDAICQMLVYDEAELAGRDARILYGNEAEFERVGREKTPQVMVEGTAAIETQFATKDGRVLDILLT